MRIWLIRSIAGAAVVATLELAHAPAMAQVRQGSRHITMGWSAFQAGQAVPFIARDAGIFDRHQLRVDLIYIGSGTLTVQALAGRDLHMAQVGSSGVVNGALQGLDLVMVASATRSSPFFLMVDPRISSPAQLKGKRIGITRFGSSTDFLARAALRRWGISPEEVTILQFGGIPEILAALKVGAVQAGAMGPPLHTQARKAGFTQLVDLGELTPYQTGVLTTSRAYIAANEAGVRDLIAAFIEAIRFAKANRAETLRIVGRFTRTTDREELEEGYNVFVVKQFQDIPRVSLAGIQAVLDELATRNPRARGARPEQFVDLRFLKPYEAGGRP